MTEIFTAKTVDEAKEMAARKFGRKINEIRFEVIDEGKKGFLGIGKTDAKVKATYVPAAAPEVKKAAPAPTPKAPAAPVKKEESKPVEVKAPEAAPAPVEEVSTKPEAPVEKAPVQEAAEISEAPANDQKDDFMDFSLDDFTLIEDEALYNEKVKIAIDYITSILNAMEVTAEFAVYQNETGAVIDVKSNNNGTIIGRRGETLDSLQYLCSIIANKGDKNYFRITIDCLGYRSKRRETLVQLAGKVAKSVMRSGRSQQLEPMNPYERRVIHSAISEIEGVTSRSVGEEPYRKIVISSNNPRRNDRRRRNDHHDDRRGDRRNRRSREPFESKAIDLSTSFEKDYKKPKPEDNMDGALYGKIEF